MSRHTVLEMLSVVVTGLSAAGCGDTTNMNAGSASTAGAAAQVASGAGASAASGTPAPATAGTTATSAGTTGGASGAKSPAAGSTATAGSSATAAAGSGMPAPTGTAGSTATPTAGAGAMAQAGAGGTLTPPTEPVANPDIGSIGLGSGGVGVSDLDKATEFFTTLVGMKVQSDVEREDRTERILTLGDMPGKPTITLMKFKDGRNTKDIPAKLVFYVNSPSAAVSKVAAGGYNTILSGVLGVGQVYAFDGYVLEFLSDATGPMFISIAFAVSDLEKTTKFYTDVFGLESTGDYFAGTLQEHFVADPDGGAALVVQHYTAMEPNYKDNPCKTVYHVADAAATLAKIVELGGTMVRPASPMPAFNNKITAIAKDFDGYVIEVVQD